MSLIILLCVGLLPAILLFKRYKRCFGRSQLLLINLGAAFLWLVPAALNRLGLVDVDLELYATAYFVLYILGLSLFNWRRRRLRHV